MLVFVFAEILISECHSEKLMTHLSVGVVSGGGGGGRPGEDVNKAPALAREGGRWGPEDPEPRPYGRDTLVEGVGGRIEVKEDATDDGGLTGVLLLRRTRSKA